MEQYDIYLCAEGDDKIKFMIHVAERIKTLSSQQKIGCFSLELDFAKYQPILDRFHEFDEQERLKHLGIIYGPPVVIAKQRGLDVIASDYRDTMADYVVNALEARVDTFQGEERMSGDRILETMLLPLSLSGNVDSGIYKEFFKITPEITSLVRFFIETNNEERERFTANFLSEYLRKQGKPILHAGSQSRIIGVQNKLMSRGYNVKFL